MRSIDYDGVSTYVVTIEYQKEKSVTPPHMIRR
jgi:hypothetical protein